MNYFDFYDLPIAFELDEGALRKLFLKKSKQYHPDFYTLESDEKQEEILALSTLNNEAYKVLLNRDKRIKYVLEQKGLLGDTANNKMSPAFLMEMMDINEKVMDLQFDFDAVAYQKIVDEVNQEEETLEKQIAPLLANYEAGSATENDNLKQILDFYLQKRYLRRLKQNLEKLEAEE